MRSPSLWIQLLVANLAFADATARQPSSGWGTPEIKTLVTFGDSFTDENRLGYFINNNGSAPPVGWNQPWGLATASGGLSWARYASLYSNTTLYNYAVSGAVCTNAITPRHFSAINAPFPDISGYEIPAFIADSKYTTPNGTKFFSGTPQDTAYAIWIGTNDLGNDAFLTDSQVKGKTVKDYVDCIYDTISRLYENGGRYFVLLNITPLHLLPQYATPENGGLNATRYFPNKPANITETSYRMQETVVALNQVFKYRTPFSLLVQDAYPEAKIADFDVSGLFEDIYYHPANYLNGTESANVTGVVNKCDVNGKNCVRASSPDSFLWFDELHPSEQASRVVAREFVGVLGGESKWATYWG